MSQASIDPNDFKATQRIAWGAAAAGWRKWWRVFEAAAQPLNERIVDLAGVKPGDKVLDVASGIGEPALTAAKRTGPTGRVLATDLAAPMLEVARERALALHLENVEFREMDAEKLDGAAASFDAATCRWAVMLVLDPVAVCRGVRRALKPGARFATSVWCEAPRVPFLAIPFEVATREANLPPPPPGAPGPMTMGKEGTLEKVFLDAGFEDIRTEKQAVVYTFESADEFANFLEEASGTVRRILETQPEEVRARVRAGVARATERFTDRAGRLRLENEVWCVSGSSPRSRG